MNITFIYEVIVWGSWFILEDTKEVMENLKVAKVLKSIIPAFFFLCPPFAQMDAAQTHFWLHGVRY